jgi:hypothetical protein
MVHSGGQLERKRKEQGGEVGRKGESLFHDGSIKGPDEIKWWDR